MKLVVVIACLIFLPLVESLHFLTLWGLNWNSPAFMETLGIYLRFLKFAAISAGLYLLTAKAAAVRHAFRFNFTYQTFKPLCYIFGSVQILLLSLGILFFDLTGASAANHRQKSDGEYRVFAITRDPGAMAKAYHYFYVVCPKPYGRYDLTLIKKVGWLGQFDFAIADQKLVVTPSRSDTLEFDLATYQCPETASNRPSSSESGSSQLSANAGPH